MGKIEALQTEYGGHKFRSRLEARWAVLLDALGADWEYEEEGAMTDAGAYLPDFKVRNVSARFTDGVDGLPRDVWLEVKGELTQEDLEKIKAFAWPGFDDRPYGKHVARMFIVGDIDEPWAAWEKYETKWMAPETSRLNGDWFYHFDLLDGDCYPAWLTIDQNGSVTFDGPDHDSLYEHWRLAEPAYVIARRARFEHGETPTRQEVKDMFRRMSYTTPKERAKWW